MKKKKPIKFVTLISQFVIEFHLSCWKLVSFHGAFKRAFGFVAQLFFFSRFLCKISAFQTKQKSTLMTLRKKETWKPNHISSQSSSTWNTTKGKKIKVRKWAEKNLIPQWTACYRNKCQKRQILGLFIHVAIIKTNRYKIPHRMPRTTATILLKHMRNLRCRI